MDWNRDGKIDTQDATLYHTVINPERDSSASENKLVTTSLSNGSGKFVRPTINTESQIIGWLIFIIAAIFYAILSR